MTIMKKNKSKFIKNHITNNIKDISFEMGLTTLNKFTEKELKVNLILPLSLIDKLL